MLSCDSRSTLRKVCQWGKWGNLGMKIWYHRESDLLLSAKDISAPSTLLYLTKISADHMNGRCNRSYGSFKGIFTQQNVDK